jgi:Fic family protein
MNRWTELTEALSQLPIFENVHSIKKQLDGIRPLSQEVEGRVMQKLRLDWNYNSNAIEGNKLTYGETHTFIMYGLTAKGKPLKDHLDIKGHDEAIKFIASIVHEDEDLREVDIRNLHKMILVEPYKSAAQTADDQAVTKTIRIGEYKQQSNHVITLTGETHYYATPEEVPILMRELVDWYNEARKNSKIHPSVLAAFVHHRFVNIHPFDDGNGRLARILMNLILMKNGYPPAIIKLKERTDYYAALNQADKNEYQAITELIAETVLDSMNLYLKAARGESIEDVSDLDKEIALFKGSFEKTYKQWDVRTCEVLLKQVFYKIFKQSYPKFEQFAELFGQNQIDFKLNGNIKTEEWFTSNVYDLRSMAEDAEIKISWYRFKKAEESFSLDTSIKIEFSINKYVISIIEDTQVIESKVKYYDDKFEDAEIDKFAENWVACFFKSLKEKVENLKK